MLETTSSQVWGLSENGKRALVLVEDRGPQAAVGTVVDGRVTGLRWECSAQHLANYAEVYEGRFPVAGPAR